mmetsp:Transcript_62172/g.158089  ORF Transcript_62172/g.158089 Transcript_62172/m.158089 type:complete len:96 (+) Transcript_62172:580-867(+)
MNRRRSPAVMPGGLPGGPTTLAAVSLPGGPTNLAPDLQIAPGDEAVEEDDRWFASALRTAPPPKPIAASIGDTAGATRGETLPGTLGDSETDGGP